MEMVDSIKIGKFIAKRRKELGLTQSQLGEKVLISRKAVSKWEQGLSIPSYDILPWLANHLDVSIEELLDGQIHEIHKVKNIFNTIKTLIHKIVSILPIKKEVKEKKQRLSNINITINIGNRNNYTQNNNLHIHQHDDKRKK